MSLSLEYSYTALYVITQSIINESLGEVIKKTNKKKQNKQAVWFCQYMAILLLAVKLTSMKKKSW